jgi:hypothetical protein
MENPNGLYDMYRIAEGVDPPHSLVATLAFGWAVTTQEFRCANFAKI